MEDIIQPVEKKLTQSIKKVRTTKVIHLALPPSHLKRKDIPENIFESLPHVEIIYLNSDDLLSLPKDVFVGVPNLKTLSIQCQNLSDLPEDIFNPLSNLGRLELHFENLIGLPERLFFNLTKLKILTVHSTRLTTISKNIFDNLINLEYLTISSKTTHCLPENMFDSLINLKSLRMENYVKLELSKNIFTCLTKLETLSLSSSGITDLDPEIFHSLINLKTLHISGNHLTSLPEGIFDNLINLEYLYMDKNRITSLPERIFAYLANLKILNISDNKLTTLPLSILGCRRLHGLYSYFNELILDIRFRRFIERMQNYKNHGIFDDGQNIHASSIQTSTKQSIDTLFNDTFNYSKDEIIKECITWASLGLSCLSDLLTYLDDTTVHSTLLVSFYDVFVKVFGRIMKHPNKLDIILRLDDELKESECKCFTGRLTRLVNCLVGFYDDIAIGISNSERISAIILSTLDGNEMTDELRKICVDKLKAIDVTDEEIKKWLS